MASFLPVAKSRYLVLAILTASQVGSSLVSQSVGALAPFMARELTLNRVQIGLIAGVIGACWIVISPLAGVIVDRFGERKIILITGVTMTGVLLAAAAVQNYIWLLCWIALYAILTCFQTPAGGRAIMLWFVRDRGVAMGIRQMGVPAAGFLGVLVLAPIAAVAGYRASIAATAVAVIVTTFLVLFLRDPETPEPTAAPHFRDLWGKMRIIARDRRTLLISFVQIDHAIGQGCTFAFIGLSLVATGHFDLASALAALAFGQAGAIVGRLVWGALSDFLWNGDRMIPPIIGCTVGALAALAISLHYPGPSFEYKLLADVAAFALCFSIAGCNGVFAMAQTEVAGLEMAGSALGVSGARTSVAMAIAPPVFGLIADHFGFSVSWVILACILALGIIPSIAARRMLQEHRLGVQNKPSP